MIPTYEQFEEIVMEAIDKHVSRDTSLVPADLEWEARHAALTIADALRINGIDIPRDGAPSRRDLSEFEGM